MWRCHSAARETSTDHGVQLERKEQAGDLSTSLSSALQHAEHPFCCELSGAVRTVTPSVFGAQSPRNTHWHRGRELAEKFTRSE